MYYMVSYSCPPPLTWQVIKARTESRNETKRNGDARTHIHLFSDEDSDSDLVCLLAQVKRKKARRRLFRVQPSCSRLSVSEVSVVYYLWWRGGGGAGVRGEKFSVDNSVVLGG